MREEQSCSIIITTYNGAEWIERCIASCKASIYPVRIIVVDNNSSDNTLDLLPNDIHLIRLNQNVGFGRANNIGMMEAIQKFNAAFVFLLNQDAYIKENTISELVDCHQKHPQLGLISPLHFDGNEKNYDYRFQIYMNRSKRKPLGEGLYQAKFVNAAAWFLTKETILKNGGFDPVFFHTGEDDNYCQRLRKHRILIAINTQAKILHDRQKRVKPKTPPHLKVANRAKIIVFNPDANVIVKFIQLIPLAFYYMINLSLAEYRTKQKLKSDYFEFQHIMDYMPKSKRLYRTKAVFLNMDYPPTFMEK